MKLVGMVGLVLIGGVIGAVVGGVIGATTYTSTGPMDVIGSGPQTFISAVLGLLIGMVVLPYAAAAFIGLRRPISFIVARVKRRRNQATVASESPPSSPPEP